MSKCHKLISICPEHFSFCHVIAFRVTRAPNLGQGFDYQSKKWMKGNNFNKQLDGNYLQQLAGLTGLGRLCDDFCWRGAVKQQQQQDFDLLSNYLKFICDSAPEVVVLQAKPLTTNAAIIEMLQRNGQERESDWRQTKSNNYVLHIKFLG